MLAKYQYILSVPDELDVEENSLLGMVQKLPDAFPWGWRMKMRKSSVWNPRKNAPRKKRGRQGKHYDLRHRAGQ